MARFRVIDLEKLKILAPNVAEDYEYSEWDTPRLFLYDGINSMVVFDDAMEPEDASLDRDLRPLVDLLNKVDAEKYKSHISA